ncbi:MAG: hypothetical protein KBC56_09150 [Flavobacterium sp.]|nr:hypothetical protein [Flavobacterium sp.]
MDKFLIFLLFHLSILIVMRLLFRKKFSILKQATICSFIFYFSIITMAIGTKLYLEHQLEGFDLDKDGFFSVEEQTKEQQKVMREVISDVGRNLAPIIGILYSGIYFIIVLLGLFTFETFKKFILKKQN